MSDAISKIKNKSRRLVELRYQECLDDRATISPEQWAKDYGYYLFRHISDLNVFYSLVLGSHATIYQGCLLLIKITFPENYPFSPPKIENLLSFPKQFNANLWSANSKQELITKSGSYQPYYGLICMDILNTAHSKIITNEYGVQTEVYDSSSEQYSPALKINAILISLRSNLLNDETRLASITDQVLEETLLKYLVAAVYNESHDALEMSSESKLEYQKLLVWLCYQFRDEYHERAQRYPSSDPLIKQFIEDCRS